MFLIIIVTGRRTAGKKCGDLAGKIKAFPDYDFEMWLTGTEHLAGSTSVRLNDGALYKSNGKRTSQSCR